MFLPKEDHHNWNGGKTIDKDGYLLISDKCNPRANVNGYVREHILVAEKILAKQLPKNAVVHHVDGVKLNNSPNNLVICEDRAYHLLLHRRERAFKATGHPEYIKCYRCKRYLSEDVFSFNKTYKTRMKESLCRVCVKENRQDNKDRIEKWAIEYNASHKKEKTEYNKQYWIERKKNETPEKRELRLMKSRESDRRCSENKRRYFLNRITNETAEEKEKRLKRCREANIRCKLKKKEDANNGSQTNN